MRASIVLSLNDEVAETTVDRLDFDLCKFSFLSRNFITALSMMRVRLIASPEDVASSTATSSNPVKFISNSLSLNKISTGIGIQKIVYTNRKLEYFARNLRVTVGISLESLYHEIITTVKEIG